MNGHITPLFLLVLCPALLLSSVHKAISEREYRLCDTERSDLLPTTRYGRSDSAQRLGGDGGGDLSPAQGAVGLLNTHCSRALDGSGRRRSGAIALDGVEPGTGCCPVPPGVRPVPCLPPSRTATPCRPTPPNATTRFPAVPLCPAHSPTPPWVGQTAGQSSSVIDGVCLGYAPGDAG